MYGHRPTRLKKEEKGQEMILELLILVVFLFLSSMCAWQLMLFYWMEDTGQRRNRLEIFMLSVFWVFAGPFVKLSSMISADQNLKKEE